MQGPLGQPIRKDSTVSTFYPDDRILAQFKDEGGASFPLTTVQAHELDRRASYHDVDHSLRDWTVDGSTLYCLNDSAMVDAAEELEDAALVLEDVAYENCLSYPVGKTRSLRKLASELRISAREWAEEVTA